MNQYEIEITGNGVWRNLNPEYVVFDDHVKEGEHRCAECRCSFCGKPSVYNYQKVKDKVVPGKVGGHQYCKPCMIIDYNKFLKQNIWEKENEKRELDLDLEKKWSDLIELADDITEYEEIEAELWSSEVAQMQKVVAAIDARIDAVNQQFVHRSHVVDCDGARKKPDCFSMSKVCISSDPNSLCHNRIL